MLSLEMSVLPVCLSYQSVLFGYKHENIISVTFKKTDLLETEQWADIVQSALGVVPLFDSAVKGSHDQIFLLALCL